MPRTSCSGSVRWRRTTPTAVVTRTDGQEMLNCCITTRCWVRRATGARWRVCSLASRRWVWPARASPGEMRTTGCCSPRPQQWSRVRGTTAVAAWENRLWKSCYVGGGNVTLITTARKYYFSEPEDQHQLSLCGGVDILFLQNCKCYRLN